MVAKQEAEDKEAKEAKMTPWVEPESVQLLLDHYIVEGKFSGRTPGTTLYLVGSKKRDGIADQIQPNQKYKLFLAACQNPLHPRIFNFF